jgi:hypothetical protein
VAGKKTERWWKDPRIMIPLAGSFVALVFGLTQLWDRLFPPPPKPPPAATVQYILDVSRGMRGSIGDVPKLEAVKDEIVSETRGHEQVDTSLRLAGPACSDDYRAPRVDFGRDRGDKIEDALRDVRASGRSDLARSVRYAVDDVLAREKEGGAKLSTLYFFVGGPDGCTKQPVRVIDRALRLLRAESNVEISLRFVGVKAPPEVRRLLNQTRRRAEQLKFSVDVDEANTAQELGESIDVPDDPDDVNYGRPGP